jgi:hypothetical protein
MKSDIFSEAIKIMNRNQSSFLEPKSFQNYLIEYGYKQVNTAANISVDSYEKLNPNLRKHNTMVFRLGRSKFDNTARFG